MLSSVPRSSSCMVGTVFRCGETHLAYLTIDHKNGGGAKHRKQVGYGSNFYRYLLTLPIQEDLQILCGNCHMAKTRNLSCLSHQ